MERESPAEAAGQNIGDVIVGIGSHEVAEWADVVTAHEEVGTCLCFGSPPGCAGDLQAHLVESEEVPMSSGATSSSGFISTMRTEPPNGSSLNLYSVSPIAQECARRRLPGYHSYTLEGPGRAVSRRGCCWRGGETVWFRPSEP